MTCDQIQIALEKEARRLLSVGERKVLAEHTRTCQACHRMRQLIASLGPTGEPVPPLRLDELIATIHRRQRRSTWLVLGTCLTLALLSFLIYSWPSATIVALTGMIFLGLVVVGARARRARLLRLATAPTPYLQGVRMELEDEIRVSRGERFFLGSAVLMGIGLWQCVAGTTGVALVLLGSGLWIFCLGAYLRFVILPRIRSELDELGEP